MYMHKQVAILKALADETRLRILNLFIKTGQNLCVCELMVALKLPQYTISKALQILRTNNLLKYEKKGLWVYYKLNTEITENKLIIKFLHSFLQKDIFKQDEKRMAYRLSIRENNKCVIGIISKKKLLKQLKNK